MRQNCPADGRRRLLFPSKVINNCTAPSTWRHCSGTLMQPILAPYRSFFRRPDVTRMVLTAFASRMPIGMTALAMLMFLRETLGSFAQAGTAVGAYFVAMAFVAPIVGRLIDRIGPTRMLWITGPVQPLALTGLLLAAKSGQPFAVLLGCAACAGVFQPPITTLIRTIWRHRFADEVTRKTAFAIDSVMIEINFTFGPAVVALILALAHPTAAFLTLIVVSALSFGIFMSSPMLKYWHHEPHAKRHLLGPLTDPRLWVLFATTFGLTFCFGILEVSYPGYATALGIAAFGGVLLAINSLGSALGGALYGVIHLRASLERQYAALLALMAVPVFLHTLVTDFPVAFAVVAVLAGILIAPALTATSMLVSRMAPSKYATEAFTWSSTFIVSGIGGGMAVGGMLIDWYGINAAFYAGSAIMLTMSLLALALPSTANELPLSEGAPPALH